MSDLPLHTKLEGFDVSENLLLIAGRSVSEIVDQQGETPLYVYSGALIESRLRKLRSALPAGVKLHYAIKANPHPEVVQLISALVDGLDVASAGELKIALSTNTPRVDISFAGPGKRPDEISAAVAAGIVLNIESETELSRVIQAARQLERRAKVAIRVNPPFELKGSGMRMSGGPKPFGIDSERVPAILRDAATSEIEFVGFHVFTGSQNLNAAAICDSQRKSLALAMDLSAHAPNPPRFINIGGGFGIPYFPGDAPLDLAPIGRNLKDLADQLRLRMPDCDLVIELGRYIVGEAGIYVCQVVDRKISRGHTFLVTDGGLHHHLSASGNFGQVIRRNYPVLVGNRCLSGDNEVVTIVGPLCTPLDILADKVTLPRAEIGDLIVVFQSGAYGLSASPRAFLSHPDAREVLI